MRQQGPTVLRQRFEFERRGLPFSAWLVGLVLVAVFCEVWLVTSTSQVTLLNDKAEKALAQASARQSYLEAQLAGTRTRPALQALAKKLGMKPADPGQVVVLPSQYLAQGDVPEDGGTSLAAMTRRVGDLIVPKAMARGR